MTSSSKKIVQDLMRHNEMGDWSTGRYDLREIDVMGRLPLTEALTFAAREGWLGNHKPVNTSKIALQT